MEGVFLAPRVLATDDRNSCKQFARTTGFGTAGLLVSATKGRLYAVTFVNKSSTAYFAQVHNKATAPLATELPIWEDVLPASGSITLDFGINGLYCSSGIGLGLSSAGGVLTFALADNATAYAFYAAL
jgi:hypothetical protein